MHARERLILEELPGERLVAVREPAPELTVWAGTGPGRGAWEDSRPANDVAAEYTPPGPGIGVGGYQPDTLAETWVVYRGVKHRAARP